MSIFIGFCGDTQRRNVGVSEVTRDADHLIVLPRLYGYGKKFDMLQILCHLLLVLNAVFDLVLKNVLRAIDVTS
jgi:hypothetical protein